MQNGAATDQFIDQLIKDKNLPFSSVEVRNELKAQLAQELANQIDRAAIEALPEDKAVELSNKLDDPDFGPEQVSDFLVNSGIDLNQIALETMIRFRAFYLGEKANA